MAETDSDFGSLAGVDTVGGQGDVTLSTAYRDRSDRRVGHCKLHVSDKRCYVTRWEAVGAALGGLCRSMWEISYAQSLALEGRCAIGGRWKVEPSWRKQRATARRSKKEQSQSEDARTTGERIHSRCSGECRMSKKNGRVERVEAKGGRPISRASPLLLIVTWKARIG
ncbi:hypothetical protein Tco_0706415 [Tanacetum coccineum]|uniref:Uncharacterized protein n=1 Tax=Tanacetum coccineum TaxID=301880 RepID=A0ABQ4Y7B3_9ASTR